MVLLTVGLGAGSGEEGEVGGELHGGVRFGVWKSRSQGGTRLGIRSARKIFRMRSIGLLYFADLPQLVQSHVQRSLPLLLS